MKTCYIKSLYYNKKKGEQLCLKTLDFDNELKALSMGYILEMKNVFKKMG